MSDGIPTVRQVVQALAIQPRGYGHPFPCFATGTGWAHHRARLRMHAEGDGHCIHPVDVESYWAVSFRCCRCPLAHSFPAYIDAASQPDEKRMALLTGLAIALAVTLVRIEHAWQRLTRR